MINVLAMCQQRTDLFPKESLDSRKAERMIVHKQAKKAYRPQRLNLTLV